MKFSLSTQVDNTLLKPTLPELAKQLEQYDSPVEAYAYLIQTIHKFPKLQQGINSAEINILLTGLLIKNGAYQEALEKCLMAIKFLEQFPNQTCKIKCWRYMAIIQGFLGDHKKQLDYNQKALQITKATKQIEIELQILNNIGDTWLSLKEYQKAIPIFEANLKHSNADVAMRCLSAKNLGEAYFKMGELENAETIFLLTLQLAEKSQNAIYIAAAKYYLGKIHLQLNQPKKANNYLAKAIEIFATLNWNGKEQLEIYEAAIQSSLQMGALDQVKKYLPDYIELHKSIQTKIQDKNIQQLHFKFSINEIEKERKLLEEQNQKLQKANQKIEQQRAALSKANEELKDFAYRVTHDIKQPIRTISSFAKLLEKDLKDQLSPRSKEFMKYIDDAAINITSFINDLLNYATSDQMDQELSLVDCNQILQQIKKSINLQLQECHAQLIINDLPSVHCHKALMTQVFQNLISNAIKFRRPNIEPIVTIRGYENEEHTVFEVADNGIGIKAEDQAKVFKLFERLNNKKDYEGSGIGLATVIKVLNKFNASIELRSEFGVGTTFYLKFPKEVQPETIS